MSIRNFQQLWQILSLYLIYFGTEFPKGGQCASADEVGADTAQQYNDNSNDNTSGTK